jgi:predicted MFS family arabinose efflux permease
MAMTDGVLGLDIGGGLLVGVGIAGTGLGVVVGMVSRAVPPDRRSQTVGLVAALGSLGTFALAPFGQWMIDALGWRGALFGFAGVGAAMALLALPLREPGRVVRTADAPETSIGATLRLAARHRGFRAMTVAYFACGFQLMFITVHLPSFLGSCGIAPALGATAIGLIGLFNAPGTYIAGLLGARYSRKRLLAAVYLFRTLIIAAFLALPISATSTLIFTAALGFLWLSVSPLISGLVDKVFGLRHFGTLYGFVFLSHQIGSFCGALLGGMAFDATGSYAIAWVALIAIGLVAFALQWPMDDRAPAQRGTAS